MDKEQPINNKEEIMNLLKQNQDLLGRKIELVTMRSIRPYIAPYILREVEHIEELS